MGKDGYDLGNNRDQFMFLLGSMYKVLDLFTSADTASFLTIYMPLGAV